MAASHLAQIEGAIGLHLQGLRLDGAQDRRPAAFVLVGVGLLAADVFLAAPAVSHQRQQVAHGAGGHEQRLRQSPGAMASSAFQAG
jgi:hypothetical protein